MTSLPFWHWGKPSTGAKLHPLSGHFWPSGCMFNSLRFKWCWCTNSITLLLITPCRGLRLVMVLLIRSPNTWKHQSKQWIEVQCVFLCLLKAAVSCCIDLNRLESCFISVNTNSTWSSRSAAERRWQIKSISSFLNNVCCYLTRTGRKWLSVSRLHT